MKKTNKSRPKLFCALALLLCLVVPLAMGTYPFGCMEGYFQDGEECQPCESSCKTCSEGTTCDTCEKYMYKNATTGLCEHCEVEEYYNLITKSCETCGTSCDEECMHRPSCMSCDGEKFLDVDDLVCVDACESGKIALNSEHLTHGRICRSAEIFIDHFSSEILELGTQTYPYRTLKSAASEILNHYSHSNFNVTIYTKEAYLQTDTFYVMNMTSITIQNHPDYQRMSQRSNIVITPDPQPGISSKSRVHLLKTINVDPNPFIDQSLYTTTEIGAFLMPKKGFFISRTNVHFKDINIYGSEVNYNIFPVHLQEKLAKIENMFFNSSGSGLFPMNPLSIHAENITCDMMKGMSCIEASYAFCNFPEAVTNFTIYANNISDYLTPGTYNYGSLIATSSPGNYTFNNIDCSHSTANPLRLSACWFGLNAPQCLPDDDLPVTRIFNNTIHNGGTNIESNGFIYLPTCLSHAPPYRKINVYLDNTVVSNIDRVSIYGLFYFWLSGTEQIHLSNFRFTNITTVPFLFQITNYASLTIDNFYFEEGINLRGKMFDAISSGPFSMSNIYLTNYTNAGGSSISPIELIPGPTTNIQLSGIHMNSFEHHDVPFMNVLGSANEMMIKDCSLNSAKIPSEGYLFYAQGLNSFSITNLTVENTTSIDESDGDSVYLSIASLNIGNMVTAQFSQVEIRNSSFSLFKINTFINITGNPNPFTIESIMYSDSIILAKRVLISTKRISMNTNLLISLSNFTFENIEYTNTGTLLEIMHQLPLNITLSDSTFNNITSGLISIEGSKQTEDLSTLFVMSNCSFTNIKSSVNTFMEVQQKTEVVIERSSFTNLTLTTFISGVMNIFDGAKVTVLHSTLTKNSATVASIAKIEANALMTIDNCSISENFAITNGVFEISSFGMAVIKNSQIFKNYAIQYPVGTVFLSTESSNITNTEIYSNKLISKSSVTTETSDDCVNLCFLHQEMKAYLNSTNLTATSEQGYLFQVLQGNLNILNSTHIHNENLVLKSFLSTVTVENSQFSNVEYSISPLNILDSTFTMEHTQISGAQASSVEESFIIANSAKMRVNNVSYSDSNSQIMISLSSHLEMNQIKIQNVSECPYLLSVMLCDWFYLASIEVLNSAPSESVMVYVHDTANITLESINVSNMTSTFAFFKNSEITKITGLKMTSLNQTLTFVNSNVKELSHSEFKDNFSNSSGGAISMTNSKLAIESTNFTRNSATEGGAIIFECTSFASCELNVTKSIFEKNSATVKGGAISYNYNYPNIIETTFINNSAVYGPNYASYPARIGERNSTINDTIEIDNVASGIIITQNLELALIDLDDQVMVLDNENQILILPSDSSKSSVSGTNTAQVKQGVAVFDNLALEVSKELRKSNFSVSSKSINSAKVKEVLGSSFQQKELEASFRDCQPGERILGDKCEVCAAGTYSLSYNSTDCAKCDFDAECLGGSEIYLRSGHWRRFHNSTKVVECINKDSCKGEYKIDGSSPAVCAEGYTGNLCAQCVVNDEVKYERVNDYECRKCPNAVWNGFQVIGVILLVLAFYIFLVIINVRKTSESELSVMLRILANYLQLITVSTSITNNFPSSILAISYPARIFGGSANVFLSFDCFIKDTEIKLFFDSNAIFKLFLLCFLPIILFCIIAVMWVFIYFMKRQWVPNPKRNLIISFITVVFLLHPKLTENSINLLRCSELDEDNKVVRIDTNIECFSSQHIKWIIFVSGPIILIWVIACPILALIIIYSGKKNSKNSNLSKYFIMIYQGLKPNRKYWEFINTLRKIVVLFSLLLSTTMAVGISMLALVLTARLQIYLDPYKNPQHSKVEYLAIMAGILTISGGLLFSQDEQHNILNSYILVAIVIINFKFILEWLYFVVSIYKKNQIAMFILKISSKLLCKKEKILSDNAKEFENANNSLSLQKNRLSSIDAQQYQTPMPKKLLPKPIKMKRKGAILKKKKRIKKCKKGRFRRMKREEEEKEQEHHNTTENQNSLRTDQRYSGRSPRSGRRNVSFYPATEAKQNKLSEFKFL